MPWFSFVVCGENYLISSEDSPPELSGFHIHKFIEAESFEIAKVLVLDEVRNDEHLNSLIAGEGVSNPSLHIEEAYDYQSRPEHLKVELGDQPEDLFWHFFPMDEENKNE